EQYDWHLLIVNASHAITDDYEVTLSALSNGVIVDERIYPDLQQMFDDMRTDGLSPVVGEGYRTHQAQENMMADKVNMYIEQGYSREDADKQARKWVAEPGTSEHELGLALDINAVDSTDAWDVYTWLADNAYKYGFILRYPSGKEEITGIDYEPWHYRYVGKEAALNIYQQDVTLEEYLEGH
ncbi:MAG: M15 family metallopeptidase, partial [Oscillospiraceae bacterium]|nr:M15 family metallopeptidase [Oscillospiraceae bacterium]